MSAQDLKPASERDSDKTRFGKELMRFGRKIKRNNKKSKTLGKLGEAAESLGTSIATSHKRHQMQDSYLDDQLRPYVTKLEAEIKTAKDMLAAIEKDIVDAEALVSDVTNPSLNKPTAFDNLQVLRGKEYKQARDMLTALQADLKLATAAVTEAEAALETASFNTHSLTQHTPNQAQENKAKVDAAHAAIKIILDKVLWTTDPDNGKSIARWDLITRRQQQLKGYKASIYVLINDQLRHHLDACWNVVVGYAACAANLLPGINTAMASQREVPEALTEKVNAFKTAARAQVDAYINQLKVEDSSVNAYRNWAIKNASQPPATVRNVNVCMIKNPTEGADARSCKNRAHQAWTFLLNFSSYLDQGIAAIVKNAETKQVETKQAETKQDAALQQQQAETVERKRDTGRVTNEVTDGKETKEDAPNTQGQGAQVQAQTNAQAAAQPATPTQTNTQQNTPVAVQVAAAAATHSTTATTAQSPVAAAVAASPSASVSETKVVRESKQDHADQAAAASAAAAPSASASASPSSAVMSSSSAATLSSNVTVTGSPEQTKKVEVAAAAATPAAAAAASTSASAVSTTESKRTTETLEAMRLRIAQMLKASKENINTIFKEMTASRDDALDTFNEIEEKSSKEGTELKKLVASLKEHHQTMEKLFQETQGHKKFFETKFDCNSASKETLQQWERAAKDVDYRSEEIVTTYNAANKNFTLCIGRLKKQFPDFCDQLENDWIELDSPSNLSSSVDKLQDLEGSFADLKASKDSLTMSASNVASAGSQLLKQFAGKTGATVTAVASTAASTASATTAASAANASAATATTASSASTAATAAAVKSEEVAAAVKGAAVALNDAAKALKALGRR